MKAPTQTVNRDFYGSLAHVQLPRDLPVPQAALVSRQIRNQPSETIGLSFPAELILELGEHAVHQRHRPLFFEDPVRRGVVANLRLADWDQRSGAASFLRLLGIPFIREEILERC